MSPDRHDTSGVLHQLVRAQAERTPDRLAAVYDDQRLTYVELIRRSENWSHRLHELGVEHGTLVGVFLERSLDLPMIVLAILETGGVCVPLDPSEPGPRIAAMLAETRPALITTQSRVRHRLPPTAGSVVVVDEATPQSAKPPRSQVGGSDLAFVLLTSGSTGTPKGVMISHSAVIARMFRSGSDLPDPGSCLAIMKTPISYSPFLGEMFAPLLHGCHFAIARPDKHQDIPYLGQLIVDHGVSHIAMPSAMLRAFVDWPEATRCQSLKAVYTGGETVSEELRNRFLQRFPHLRLIVTYGTTEAGHSLSWEVRSNGHQAGNRIGRSIPMSEAHLFDAECGPTPPGEIGELYLGGPRLATGYLNRPEWTAERFVGHPSPDRPGVCLYRTGDLARLRPDGDFEFIGRVDQQVKIRGNRVELLEVEAALAECPGVRKSAVLARSDDRSNVRLVAFFVPGSGSPPDVDEIRQRLSEKLPFSMVPQRIVPLEDIPLTPSGKLDRKFLATLDASDRRDCAAEQAPPQSSIEASVAEIWQKILGVARIDRQGNFFELGGDSLQATQMLAQVRDRFSVELAARDLFLAPTISRFAAAVETRRTSLEDRGVVRKPHPDRRASRLDPGDYCDVIREGDGEAPLVCVGSARPIPFLLERVSKSIPVLHLKLDGVHVWPPRFFFPEEQFDVFRRALELRSASRQAAIIGFSYGATLAYPLAGELQKHGWSNVNALMIEPTTPTRFLRFWRSRLLLRRARRLAASLLGRLRLRGHPHESAMASELPDESDADARWLAMAVAFRRVTDSIQPCPLQRKIALVGCRSFHSQEADRWRRAEPGGVEQCVFSDTDDHFACFRQPYVDQWVSFLEQWYRESFGDRRSASFRIADRSPAPASGSEPKSAGREI